MKDNSKLINHDTQGWGVFKMNFRDILTYLGVEHKDGIWTIKDNDPILDAFPLLLEDDGMGYGVHEQYITEARYDKEMKSLIMFRDSKQPKIELWKDSKFYEGALVKPKKLFEEDKDYIFIVRDIRKEKEEFEYYVEYILFNDNKSMVVRAYWFEEKYLDWG